VVVTFAVALLVTGCASLSERSPVPQRLVEAAQINGMGDVRLWGDVVPKNIKRIIARKVKQVRTQRPSLLRADRRTPVNFLALSGGADDGAFGAGLLAGWSKTGRRPEFEIVTGVSTGALMAPFVFLGPAYDGILKEIYTRYSTKDILIEKPLVGLLGGSSLADPTPLADLIAHHVDQALLNAIAQEYRKGRTLLVSTTNLDAQRPVLWNMGRIAASGHTDALSLFRRVLLASVSIPGAFPPVQIKVTAGGKHYDELHVDGGTSSKVFLLPTHLMFRSIDHQLPIKPKRRLFIIMNDQLVPVWKPVEASLFPLSQRSLKTLLKNQGIGDLSRLYISAQRDGTDYNLASIPSTFKKQKKEFFDKEYMTALFNLGFGLGRKGYRWAKQPPDLQTASHAK